MELSPKQKKEVEEIKEKLEKISGEKQLYKNDMDVLNNEIKSLAKEIVKSVNLSNDRKEKKRRTELRAKKTDKEENLAWHTKRFKDLCSKEQKLLTRKKFLEKGY